MKLYLAVYRMWRAGGRTARRLASMALVTILASSLAVSLAPLLLQVLVDDLVRNDTGGTAERSAFLILAYAALIWLSKAARELQELFLSRSDQRFSRRLSADYFRHLVALPLTYHVDQRSGAVSQTLTNGLLGFRTILQHIVGSIVPLFVEFAAMAVILFAAGHMAFVGLAALALASYVVVFWFGTSSIHSLARNASIAQIDSGAIFTDSVLNIETVKSFRAEHALARRFGAALKRTEACWRELFRRKTGNGLVVACIFALTVGTSIYVAVHQYYAGNMTVGEIVLVNAYMLQLMVPVETAGFALRDIAQGRAFIEQMAGVLSIRAEASSAAPAASDKLFDAGLRFENVSFTYDGHRSAVRQLNFDVPPGRTVAIVGKSGSGKSSIARLLLRLVEPTEGQIRIGGKPLADVSPGAIRDAIALVPQNPILIDDSIAYNIALGRRRSSRDDIVEAAKIAGLHDFVATLPCGYDTKVGERGLRLSGGERQRIAIARAVVRRPELFIFDEATSSLDPSTEIAVTGNLNSVSRTATVIVITHRLATVRHADQILVLDDGTLAEKGTHGELVALDGLYAEMWRAQRERSSGHRRASNHSLGPTIGVVPIGNRPMRS